MNRWRYVFICMWFLFGVFCIYRVFADDITLTTINPGSGWTVSGDDVYATGSIDPKTGNVGIGTAGPEYKLDINSTTDADLLHLRSTAGANNTLLRLGISGNSAVISGSGGSSGSLLFKTYGSDRMFIDTSGNVGIGTTAPQATLHVVGTVMYNNIILPYPQSGTVSLPDPPRVTIPADGQPGSSGTVTKNVVFPRAYKTGTDPNVQVTLYDPPNNKDIIIYQWVSNLTVTGFRLNIWYWNSSLAPAAMAQGDLVYKWYANGTPS